MEPRKPPPRAGNLEQDYRPAPNSPLPHKRSKKKSPGRAFWTTLGGLVLSALLIGSAVAAGGLAGYYSGVRSQQAAATLAANISLEEQFNLAVEDLNAGRYEVARQRLDYILKIDPAYPGVAERLAEAMAVLYATATPTLFPPTTTSTPTVDPRPAQELLAQARANAAAGNWSASIDTLLALRKADSAFEVAKVDGLLFISLRQRGVDKIWQEGNLEGGIYDLALAARFAPLDAQANSAREAARLYLFGSSFWEVYPEQAVYWFSQAAAAAPNLTDGSGWTAAARYAEALIQYGDQFYARGDWCSAQEQYLLAIQAGAGGAGAKHDDAALKCSPPTAAATATGVAPTATPITPAPATTQPPVITTPPPAATTPPPVATTEPPVNTTEPPVETTEPPATTEPAVETTEPPAATDAPAEISPSPAP